MDICFTLYTCLIFVLFANKDIKGQIFKAPKNKVIKESVPAELDCSIRGRFQVWQEYYTSSEPTTIAVNGEVTHPFQSGFGVRGDPGNYALMIHTPHMSMGGTYSCTDLTASQRRYAEVVILDSEPFCNSSLKTTNYIAIEGDTISFTCFVKYQGNLKPEVLWYKEPNMTLISEGGEMNIIISNDIPKVASLILNMLVTRDLDGMSIKASNIGFNFADPPLPNHADNAPDYRYSWTTRPLDVQWGPQEVHIKRCPYITNTCTDITDDNITIYQYDTLLASADSKPEIDSITWTIGHNTTYNSSDGSLVLAEPGYTVIRCVVVNTLLDGRRRKAWKSIHVEVLETILSTPGMFEGIDREKNLTTTYVGNGLPIGSIVGIVVGCVAVFIIITILVVFNHNKFKKTKKPPERPPSAVQLLNNNCNNNPDKPSPSTDKRLFGLTTSV